MRPVIQNRLTLCLRVAFCVLMSGSGFAQNVGIAGRYSEQVSQELYFPMNPPITVCAADATAWNAQNRARCMQRRGDVVTTTPPPRFEQPHYGVHGAGIGTALTSELPPPPSGGGIQPGVNVGDPFRVPPGFFFPRHNRQQVGFVLNHAIRQVDTSFTALAPAPSRVKNPPSDTRVFHTNGWVGQDNGLTGTARVERSAAAQTLTFPIGIDSLTVEYTPGTNAFGGTMATLLRGGGRVFFMTPNLSAVFPTSQRPAIGTAQLGSTMTGFVERQGAGWDYTVMSALAGGEAKAYGIYPTSIQAQIIGPDCTLVDPPSPVGCNEVNFWSTPLPGATPTSMAVGGAPGIHFGQAALPAVGTRHLFAFTTGTVRLSYFAIRDFGSLRETVTGMGYDTISSGGNRNVGLVAGGFAVRSSLAGLSGDPSLVGVEIEIVPSPSVPAGIGVGLLLLSVLGARRSR